MAFFDDLNKMVSNASKKTRDIADSAKINSAISEEEKKINAVYQQIGKLYASLHMNDYEQDFSGMMAQVAECESKLAGYRLQLQQIKGVRHCEKCGSNVALNSSFCPECGNAMPKAENGEELEKCVSCGSFVPKSLRFCTNCGNPMIHATEPFQAAAPVPPVQNQPAGFCTNCGSSLLPDSDFCTECGAKISL